MDAGVGYALRKLAWMRERRIWPNGLRYLWTDAFGVVLLVSLHEAFGDARYLDEAEQVVSEVERVLGRPRGVRIGEEPDRDGQYFHHLAMWLFALQRLGRHRPRHHARAIALGREIHPRFVIPGAGVVWKMLEDLSAPYPGFGLGALDAFHGYVVYSLLDETELASEIADMAALVAKTYSTLAVTQDTSAASRHSGTCDSPSRTMGCPWACRPWALIPSGSGRSTTTSRRTARATHTTPLPSRT